MKTTSTTNALLNLTLRILEQEPELVTSSVYQALKSKEGHGRFGQIRVPATEFQIATKAIQERFEERLKTNDPTSYETYIRRLRIGRAAAIALGVLTFVTGLALLR